MLTTTFDTRPYVLTIETEGFGEPERGLWEATKARIRQELVSAFGQDQAERKEHDFVELGPAPFSVVGYHNRLLGQCRLAFIAGAYYPALLGVCGLGERLLNHLVLDLRGSFTGHPATKQVALRDSIQNWKRATETLQAWDVVSEQVVELFRQLEGARQAAVHYRPVPETVWRDRALSAIRLFEEIVRHQFETSGADVPWLFEANGAVLIRRVWEERPFVRNFYLPNCALVSPRHELTWETDHFTAYEDPADGSATSLSDEEYAHEYEQHSR